MKENLIITPKTKILDIIETYPQLEEKLIEYVPAFSKLKNPVLRRTIGKITTLQQAASVGNVNINELIGFFRKEIGQDADLIAAESDSYNYLQPSWYVVDKIVDTLDAREMLNRGEHPVGKVIDDLKHLKTDEIYALIVQFLPAPLIDKASGLGFSHWIDKESETEFKIYFCRKEE